MNEIEFIEESIQCCVICPETNELLNSLLNHIKGQKCKGTSKLKKSFKLRSSNEKIPPRPDILEFQLCSCPSGIQLQNKIISHLLHQIWTQNSVELDLIVELDESIVEKNLKLIEVSKNIVEESKVVKEGNLEFKIDEKEILDERSCPQNPQPRMQIHLDNLANFKSDPESSEEPQLPHDLSSQFHCQFCPKILRTKSGLSKHIKMMHNPDNKFKCNRCSNGFCSTLKNLHAHMRIHENIKLESKICEKCNKKFQNEKQLYHHSLLHREKLLECDHCGMRFNMKQPLQKHIFTHFDIKIPRDPESKALCEICSKLVASSRMKRHLGTHFNESRPANFKCDIDGCSKAFTELRNLLDHQNCHNDLKPYVCDFCGSNFRHRAALRQHRMRHTEPEKHKCPECFECFVTNQSLKKHLTRQHRDCDLDVRPFACDYEGCNSTFKYEDFLTRHKKDVHSPKPQIQQKCDLCSYVAHNMKNYFQHMRRTHDVRKRLNNRVFPSSSY